VTNFKIAVETRSLRLPLRQALETAARLGADGVEIDLRHELPIAELSKTGIREIRKLLGDLNLGISAAAFPTRRGYDVADDLERRILATQQAMKAAYELGTRIVINRAGRVPDDTGDERFGRLVEVLEGLSRFGERSGARLALQTGSESGGCLAQLLQAIPNSTLGVDLHPSGLIMNGHSPQEAVAALGRNVIHVHACDAVRDFSLGRALEVELGRGTADMPALLGQLEEFGYRGWITIERRDSADPLGDVENAIAYLKTLNAGN
jgi:sugar phosphate isomerase/epimerase